MTDSTSRLPKAPTTIAETGISTNSLLRLLLKTMYVRDLDLGSELAKEMRVSGNIVQDLLDEARDRDLVETRGSAGASIRSEIRYGLMRLGRDWAAEALELSQYVGPVPVSLADYTAQIAKQPLLGEHVEESALHAKFSQYVVPDTLVRRLGQAINSARALLLYGMPGNGKTSLAEIIGELFNDVVFLPYCLEVDSKIIKIYDPAVHQRVTDPSVLAQSVPELATCKVQDIDGRWVACRRPMVRAGGELTLEMLDLQFNEYSKFYEAPLHMKAIGGTFLIDDLGRQLVKPEDLLNRWITPLDRRMDFLSLDTGRTFTIPFDVFVIFATNLTPEDLMDPAFLRRIPYKVRVKRPTPENYRQVFRNLCEKHGLAYDENTVDFVMQQVETALAQPLSYYQPGFIVEQIVAACKFDGRPLALHPDLLVDALDNMSLKEGMVRRDAAESIAPTGAPPIPPANGGAESRPEKRP